MEPEALPKPINLTVVIPCRNEAKTIAAVLGDLELQDLSRPFEVIVADGRSVDGTREVLEKLVDNPPFRFALRIVDNPDKAIPSGLNRAVERSAGKFIVRIDAHARLPRDYLRTIVESLEKGLGDVVGPQVVNVASSNSATGRTIAAMLNTRFGNGGTPSRNRIRVPTRVAHAVMSCYRREVWNTLGGYDESLLANEDFEFDYRANRAGFSVLSLPSPVYQLFARSTLGEYTRQRWRYGKWKGRVLAMHPGSLRFRQIIPILLLPASIALAIVDMPLALVAAAGYSAVAAYSVVNERSVKEGGVALRAKCAAFAPLVAAITHFVWGAGVVSGLVNRPKASKRNG
jgi:succinoglycan biosynthesis protein ExoA